MHGDVINVFVKILNKNPYILFPQPIKITRCQFGSFNLPSLYSCNEANLDNVVMLNNVALCIVQFCHKEYIVSNNNLPAVDIIGMKDIVPSSDHS